MTDLFSRAPFRAHKIRLIRQTELAECGLACVAMIASAFGNDASLGNLRRRFTPSMRGVTLRSLIEIADQLGLSSRALKLSLDALTQLQMPAILHWDMKHFVVVETCRRRRLLIHDPAGRSSWMSMDEVSAHFTGVALEVSPAADFQISPKAETLKIRQLWTSISGFKRSVAQVVVLSLLLQVLTLAIPYYTQLVVDQALPAQDFSLLGLLATGFVFVALFQLTSSIMRSFVLLNAGALVSFGVSSNVARRLFRLPVTWFERRNVGDILSRFQSVAPIQQVLTQGAIGAVMDGLLAIATIAMMTVYSVWLTVIALIGLGCYLLVRAITFARESKAREAVLVNTGAEQSTMIETLRGITTLRLSNRESVRHSLWQSRLMDATNAEIRLARLGIWQTNASLFVTTFENIFSLWVAIVLVIRGGFSVGMIFAFMAYKTQFLSRAMSLVDQISSLRMLGLHLERLSDIALSEEDVSFLHAGIGRSQLLGRIEFKNVTYRYNPLEPEVISDVSFVVEPGEHVAITGPSGGGKTTLVKLLLGLIEPESGSILIDGQPLAGFGYKNLHEQTGAVLQEDALFAGTLADNIALFDENVDQHRVETAAKAAAVHDDIVAMPMRYNTFVGDMGSALSGGQKQRILIARALYRRPSLLVMDEGTSHLDAEREMQVNAAVSELGITRIIVAHRQETIRAASRVLEIAAGSLRELSLQSVN